MKKNEQLDYIQASVESIELIALLFVTLTKKQRMKDFSSVLQTIIEGVNKGFKEGKIPVKFWESMNNVATWAKGRWDETPEIESFNIELREKREYFLMHISSDTNFTYPKETFEKIFDEYTAIDSPMTDENEKITGLNDDEQDLDPLDTALRKILRILRNE